MPAEKLVKQRQRRTPQRGRDGAAADLSILGQLPIVSLSAGERRIRSISNNPACQTLECSVNCPSREPAVPGAPAQPLGSFGISSLVVRAAESQFGLTLVKNCPTVGCVQDQNGESLSGGVQVSSLQPVRGKEIVNNRNSALGSCPTCLTQGCGTSGCDRTKGRC